MQITGASASTINIPKAAAPAVKESPFNINQRFSFVEKLVRMVASGVQPSAIITGEGGLGKTYTVNKTLKECGYVDVSATTPEEYRDLDTLDEEGHLKEFISIKGYSTPKALYRSLFDHNGKTIVFDDCDSVLKDQVAINLLKGALDSYDTRIISWYAEFPEKEYLPNSFEFTGKVIFISNMDQSKVDQAIRSRSMMIDLSMTLDQKISYLSILQRSKQMQWNISVS
jgi:Cdc6-like AAA superfamily ATPase